MCRLLVNTFTMPGAVHLHRYDVECPPEDWDADFKNQEYVYSDECEDLRIKNRIGAYFFFDNKVTAYCTGAIAAKKLNRKRIWLTETSIASKIQLLDFSHFDNISSLLLAFDEIGFDVLTERFHKFNLKAACESFAELRPLVERLKQLYAKPDKTDKEHFEIINTASDIGNFFYGNHRIYYFGQILSDFSNGIEFKEMLLSKGYDGYIFRESHDSPTYCILNSDALSKPVHQEIAL